MQRISNFTQYVYNILGRKGLVERSLTSNVPLSKILIKDCNNFDLVRLICACMVIYGHAFAVAPELGKEELIYKLTGFYAGAIAVKVFFFLSGLLVTNSLIEKKSLIHFFMARFFRIWPALILVLLFSVFVIGPVLTTLDLNTYLSSPNTYLYIKNQILMKCMLIRGLGYTDLPGLFTQNPFKDTVNVPLWTLPVEVGAYIFLGAIFCLKLLEKRIAIFLFIIIILDSILPQRIFILFLPQGNDNFSYLPFCFSVGVLMAIYKENLFLSMREPIGFFLLFLLFSNTEYAKYFFYLSVFTGIIYFFTCKPVLRLKPSSDISYGVYLWGWPMQQILVSTYPNMGVLGNQVFGTSLAMIFGYFSWHLIEKRSIKLGKKLANWVCNTRDPAQATKSLKTKRIQTGRLD